MTTESGGTGTGGTGSGERRPGDAGAEFGRRAEEIGREFGHRAEHLGAEAEAAGRRLAKDPAVTGFVDVWSRFWGVVLIAVGLWFFADVTLEVDLPSIPWGDLWPVLLIALGVTVVLSGMRRRA